MVVQWVRLGIFTAEGPGSVPGQGTKIPRAMRHGQKKKGNIIKLFRNMKVNTRGRGLGTKMAE